MKQGGNVTSDNPEGAHHHPNFRFTVPPHGLQHHSQSKREVENIRLLALKPSSKWNRTAQNTQFVQIYAHGVSTNSANTTGLFFNQQTCRCAHLSLSSCVRSCLHGFVGAWGKSGPRCWKWRQLWNCKLMPENISESKNVETWRWDSSQTLFSNVLQAISSL